MPSQIVDNVIIEEGWRNAVVKLTGVLTNSDVSEVSVITPSQFSNNDKTQAALVGFRVDHITYSIANALEVLLAWNGGSPQVITPLSGRGKMDVTDDGGFLPDQTRTGYDGSINLSTTGYTAAAGTTQNFTVLLRLVKLYRRQ